MVYQPVLQKHVQDVLADAFVITLALKPDNMLFDEAISMPIFKFLEESNLSESLSALRKIHQLILEKHPAIGIGITFLLLHIWIFSCMKELYRKRQHTLHQEEQEENTDEMIKFVNYEKNTQNLLLEKMNILSVRE